MNQQQILAQALIQDPTTSPTALVPRNRPSQVTPDQRAATWKSMPGIVDRAVSDALRFALPKAMTTPQNEMVQQWRSGQSNPLLDTFEVGMPGAGFARPAGSLASGMARVARKAKADALGGVSDDAAEAAREAAEAALKRRMEHSVYQRGDKVFDPAEALEKSGLIRRNRDGHDWATGSLPDVIPDDIMKKSRQGDYGDLLIDAKDAPESWFDDLTDGDGSTLSPYFDKQIRKDDFEFHVSDYDPEDLEYSSITLMPKNEPDLYARLSSDALGEVQIGSLEDALTHENHLARAAAFREVLRQNNVPFETIENGINSEYIFLHDEAADRMLKIRFADHGNQSVHHDRADFNISDDWRDKAHVEKALNAALEFSRPRNNKPIKGAAKAALADALAGPRK